MSEIPIKSVKRVFEILELFDRERSPLGAKKVADALGYPLMSTHELLKSMQHLGYAEYDVIQRAYAPSFSIAELVDWTRNFVERETDILDFMGVANRETRETVNLSRRINANVKIIHGLETLQPVGVSVKIGTEMPVANSLTGLCSLACMDEARFEEFIKRYRKIGERQFKSFNKDVFSHIRGELLEYGAVCKCDLFVEGIGAVCMPVLAKSTGEALVIGIVGPSERIRQNQAQHRKTLKRLSKQFSLDTPWPIRLQENR